MAMTAMAFFLFFVSYAVCSEAGRLLGGNRCAWGASYWCRDYGTAIECNAVQHCQMTVWKTKNGEMDTCTLCELAVKRVKSIFDQPAMQKQFLDFLKDLCDDADLGPLTDTCKQVVTKYEPDIIKILENILADPEKVCTKMGMCKSQDQHVQQLLLASLIKRAKPRFQVQPFGTGLADSQICLMCKSSKKDLENIPSIKKRIEVSLQQVCNRKSVFDRKECQQAIIKLVPVITSLLKIKVSQVCIKYNTASCMATPRAVQQRLPTSQKLQDIGCDFCIYFMTEAEGIVRNASLTEKEFEKLILGLCDDFGFMAFKCKQMVEQFLPLLYEMLMELKPYQVCQEIMMCPAAAEPSNDPRCILGASFWCANLRNAERCNALLFCKSQVWHAQN